MILFLIGSRGVGKTTVGRLVAAKLAWTFVDLDQRIVERDGRSIAQIFRADGEAGFRRLEREALAEAVAQASDGSNGDGTVLALGGGAVLDETNRRLLRNDIPAKPPSIDAVTRRYIAWLDADIETMAARLAKDAASMVMRPPLTELDAVTEIRSIHAARTPTYSALADLRLDTTGRSPESVAEAVVAALRS